MSDRKKRSKLRTMWYVVVDAVHEPILKHKDKLNIKTAGILVGKAASLVAKPAVQLYDGVREGYNQKTSTKEEKHGSLR
jgi:hypothetical protein